MSVGGGVGGSCHCGAVTIRLAERPSQLADCNCSLCRKLGWRLVYGSSVDMTIDGPLERYVRHDMDEPTLAVMRCATCGIATHWEPLGEPPHARIGVNANLLEDGALDGASMRTLDGRSWER